MSIDIIKLTHKALFITLLISTMFWAGIAHANNLANQGYSVVSYFEKDKAEMGSPEFSVEHKGKHYWFTSSDQVDAFNTNPTRYIPVFAEFCPYSLSLGRMVAIDPTNFKIVGDRLLLFHRSDEMDGLKAWEDADNEKELLRRATGQFSLFEF